jgi:DNA polymerase-1
MNLYLIDGNSYVYRAFHAIKGLVNSKGFPTNAIYGFTNTLLKIIREKKPDAIAVMFDCAAPTKRHRMFEAYKAQRPETPNELIQQLPFIREMVKGFNIKIFEMPGYEADDIIGTVAKNIAQKGIDVFLVTADKDMLQLIAGNIKVYDPIKEHILDEEYVKEKFGVGPERVTEFMALTGDAADNIPGVKGIGEKTAKELLSEVSSLDEIISNPSQVKKERIRDLIIANCDILKLSRELVTIDCAVPVEFDIEDLKLKEPDWDKLAALFKEFEFTRFMKLIPATLSKEKPSEIIFSIENLREIISKIKEGFSFNLITENKSDDEIVGLSLALNKDYGCYIPLGHSYLDMPEQINKTDALETIAPLFSNENISKTGSNLKNDISILQKNNINTKGKVYDIALAYYLLNPNKSNPTFEDIAFEFLSQKRKTLAEIVGKKVSLHQTSIEEAAAYSTENAMLALELKDLLFKKLMEGQLEKVYFDIEMPLIYVLSDIEQQGVKVDTDKLNDISKELSKELDAMQRRIFFLAGEEFNINSPQKLAKILFEKLKLKPGKKTKTGFSTEVGVLEELSLSHELPQEILNWRSMNKLKTTYVDILPAIINPKTGRIHTSLNQTATATGRLSSSEPNLQSIPIKGEWGRRIRETFISEQGNLLISADYSQIELRILAHLSSDKSLIDAFSNNIDVHSKTASDIFGVSTEAVTPEMRRTAKVVNFGVIYGMSSFGLSQTLSISRAEAQRYIDRYFDKHTGVKKYIEKVLDSTVKSGYTYTISGRCRPIPELKSSNSNIRLMGERFSINTPVQGTAADLIKIAMINLYRRFQEKQLETKMILQVHDEILFESPEEELEVVKDIIKLEMENVIKLAVPLVVDIGFGQNWAEAH